MGPLGRIRTPRSHSFGHGEETGPVIFTNTTGAHAAGSDREDHPADTEPVGLFEAPPLRQAEFDLSAERFISQASTSYGRRLPIPRMIGCWSAAIRSPQSLFSLK